MTLAELKLVTSQICYMNKFACIITKEKSSLRVRRECCFGHLS